MGRWLWAFIWRLTLLTLVPAVLMLSSCWEVAAPLLLGVGTVGTGFAVASAKRSGHKEQTPTPANAKQNNDSEAAGHPGAPADKSHPIAMAEVIQESTLPASPRLAAMASTEDVGREFARPDKPRLVARKHRSRLAALPRSTPPPTLPETVIIH